MLCIYVCILNHKVLPLFVQGLTCTNPEASDNVYPASTVPSAPLSKHLHEYTSS